MPWRPLPLPSKDEVRQLSKENRRLAKFLVDESLGSEVTHVLRSSGRNVTDVFELNLAGQPDENVFAAARRDDRIILTHDPDFLDNRRFPPQLNPGLVVLPGAEGDSRALLSALRRAVFVVGQLRELWRSTKIVITADGTWTVWTFDRDEGRITKARYRFPKHRIEVWEDAVEP